METAAAFLGISALVIVTPGQDTVLTIRNTGSCMRGGGRLWSEVEPASANGRGATQAERASLSDRDVRRRGAFGGAAFLVYLGAQALIAAIRGSATHGVEAVRVKRLVPGAALRQGLVSNLGNPKMAVFFTSLLPQFVPSGPVAFLTMLGLGLVFCCMTLGWLSAYALAVGRAGDVLGRPAIRRALDGVVGTVLVVFGIRLAFQQR